MRTVKRWPLIVMGLLALPSYAAAQTLPTTPPSGYFNAVAANPKGTVTNITYGSSYAARVYTPPGYSRSQAYPYMFLMHGLGGSEASWHDNDLYAHIQLDNLIAQGAVDPFIIVFTRNDYDNWNFGPILINNLIPYVEANYCVSTDPDNRALGGLSMGGMQTINIGFPNADKFHYLMPSSPAPGIQGQSQLFPNGGALAKANLKLIFFTCGSGEVGAYGCNNVNTVSGYARSVGLGSIIKEFIVQGGAHDRNTWRPSFWNFAQLADQAGFTQVGTMRSSGCTGGTTGHRRCERRRWRLQRWQRRRGGRGWSRRHQWLGWPRRQRRRGRWQLGRPRRKRRNRWRHRRTGRRRHRRCRYRRRDGVRDGRHDRDRIGRDRRGRRDGDGGRRQRGWNGRHDRDRIGWCARRHRRRRIRRHGRQRSANRHWRWRGVGRRNRPRGRLRLRAGFAGRSRHVVRDGVCVLHPRDDGRRSRPLPSAVTATAES